MTVTGNACVRSAVIGMCQARHSESIAAIGKSVGYVVVMLELMG